MRSVPHSRFSRDMVTINCHNSGLRCGRPPPGARLPVPGETPALPMPAGHGIRRDDREVLPPAGTPAVSQDPEQLVPGVKASAWSGSCWPSQDGELVA